ncbi:FK506-binding protein 2B [Coemansia aciculifera]|uniref:FK506-binding protein 2B n=1 Tax=Coemansia aciculifera TaxID=417176 RepID=A0ACC1M919_9FUNG|nr:FK506-binding protein 2B [Coemansia aciculifera]KAJ2909709.1 FK506-binding protein 2B [Coemansia aciculifera]
MSEIAPKWTAEELAGDGVSKKDLVSFLHESGSNVFLLAHKLNGKQASVVKTAKKPALIAAYKDLFETKQFRSSDEVSATEIKQEKAPAAAAAAAVVPSTAAEAPAVAEAPKYTKRIIKKGTGDGCPSKGDRVSVFYSGWLEDGTLFDTNTKSKGRKPASPLVFKVGTSTVIRGWDEALLTMKKGEVASLTIQPEWAYGQRGNEAGGIPPNATLKFEVTLVQFD